MAQTRSLRRINRGEHEEGEKIGEIRQEYVDGEVFALAAASDRHNRIAGNLLFQLRAAARGDRCALLVSDMRIRVRQGERYYHPDVAVACDAQHDHPYRKDRPCIRVEVLSDNFVT